MYSLIYEELSKGNQKFECPISVTADQLTRAVDSVLNDHPELFWIDNALYSSLVRSPILRVTATSFFLISLILPKSLRTQDWRLRVRLMQ